MLAWFPWKDNVPGSPGSLVYKPDFYSPSYDGVPVYFTSQTGDLSDKLSRVEKSGGKVIMHKILISEEYGYMGLFMDTEGNRIAVHSRA